MLPMEEARLMVGLLLIVMIWGSCLTTVGALGLAGVFSHK